MLRRPRFLAVVVVLGLVLSACDWAQFRFGPDGTGFNPFESTISASNVSKLQQRWTEVSGVPSWESPPVVANGIVYASTCGVQAIGGGPCQYNSRLDAFDAATGSGRWSIAKSSSNVFGTGYPPAPAVANGLVYDVAGSTVFAVDASTGTKRWSINTGEGVYSSALVVAGHALYVASGNGLFAYDATNGVLLWSATVGDGGDQSPKVPAVANGIVYTTLDGHLSAFDADTGKLRWAIPPSVFSGGSSPAIANGIVYVDEGSTLLAFNAIIGTLAWSARAPSDFSWQGSPSVANGIIYLADNNSGSGDLDAFNATTGASIWSTSTLLPTRLSYSASSPVVANGVVYLGVDDAFVGLGQLQAFDATTGTRLWSGPATTTLDYSPVIANGVLYTSAYGFCPPVSCAGYTGSIETYGLPLNGSALTIAPAFVPDFGTVLDGSSSPASLFTVTNFGSTATAVTATLTGADPSQYQITPSTCAGPLAAGASCTIKVAFAPTLPGKRTATLALHGTAGGTATVTLSGTGDAISISPNGYDYGFVVDGTTTAPTTFTVTNHSVTTVTTTVGSLAGSPFTATSDTCSGATLAPGAICRIGVTFTAPDIAGSDFVIPYNTNLSVTSTLGITTTVGLAGTGTPIAILPATKDYGTVSVGSSSSATFTIKNVSSLPVSAPFGPSGVTGDGFSITSDGCNGVTLAGDASCTVVVTFTPGVAGTTYDGQLTVYAVAYGIIEMNSATLIGTGG
jgi:outer membrane protein assembly factor BamB